MAKKVKTKYTIIPANHAAWALLKDARKHHPDLEEASIALAWRQDWKADVDGIRTLGKCKKVSVVDRLFQEYDFVIIINSDAWALLTDAQRLALLDHELCHAQVKMDKDTGETVTDACGRNQYRVRKHDLEEFREVVERHGMYKQDIMAFVKAAARAKAQPLLEQAEAMANGGGGTGTRAWRRGVS